VQAGRAGMFRMNRAFALVVLLCASGAGAAPTYTESTRLYTHTNDNGQAQGIAADRKRLHVGDPGTYGHKNPAQTLMPKVRADTQREAGSSTTLVQSITTVGVEGWTTVRADNNPSTVQLGADIGKGVVGSDTGSETWYFLAPGDKFAGDLLQAYNGRLSLTLVHAETPSGGSIRRQPDVILEATCGHSLMLYNFASKSGDLSVMLNEDAGWIDSRTKSAPGAMDFLGVLSHLAAVKVRGGYYAGAESTRLSSVTVTAGKSWYPCCTLDGTVDLCQKKPSSYYNPAELKFYCEGHMYRPVKVTRVLPRFGRRTGGSIVTVIGENFGLSGSNPIVRINGRACQRTYYAPSVVRDESQYEAYVAGITSVANMYTLQGTGAHVMGASNGAGNALINAYNSATDSMKQQYPEHCWNGMQDDGSDKGFNYGTAAAPKYINQGEKGVDTGGPCFPEHCSSCPVPSTAANAANIKNTGSHVRCSLTNQIQAVSSTECKGRGNDAVFCAFDFPYLKYPSLCPEDAPYSSRLKMAYTSVHYSAATGFGWDITKNTWLDIRRDYGHRRWNKYGMFGNVNRAGQAVEGVTRVTKPNLAMGTTTARTAIVKAGTYLIDTSTQLWVIGACDHLFGVKTYDAQGQLAGVDFKVSCGSEDEVKVTQLNNYDEDSDGIYEYCMMTVDVTTITKLGIVIPGTVGQVATSCQAGSTVSVLLASAGVASYSESGAFMHVEDAVGLCGLNYKPLGPGEGTNLQDYTVATNNMLDNVQRVTTVAQVAALANSATTLIVADAVALLGDLDLTVPVNTFIQCGTDPIIQVVSYIRGDAAANPNQVTLTGPTVNELTTAAQLSSCHRGAPVRRIWTITLKSDFTDRLDEYFHATADEDSFGIPTVANPAYVMLYDKSGTARTTHTTPAGEVNGEIVKVVGLDATLKHMYISERGSFGTPIIQHTAALTKQVVAVEVCRGAAVRIGPSAATGSNHFTAAVSANAECQGYDGPTATDGRYCKLRVAAATNLLKTVRLGDVVSRMAQGRTQAAATLSSSGTTLTVKDAALLAAGLVATRSSVTNPIAFNFFVSCGGDTTLLVTAVDFATNKLTVDGGTANALAVVNGAGACNAQDIVTVVKGVAVLHADALAGATEILVEGRCENLIGGPPVYQKNDGTTVLTGVDIGGRDIYVQCGTGPPIKILRVAKYVLADNLCHLTVATGHASCTTALAGFVYNANVGTFPGHQEYTTTFDVLSVAELSTSDAGEFGYFRYVKIDDEIMRITDLADGVDLVADSVEGEPNGGYERLTVARAQLGTLAAPHDRDAVVTLLPRMTELSQAVTADAFTLYLPSQADLFSNNINVAALSTAGFASAGRQLGGTVTAYYIKVDDEIMKITASRSIGQVKTADAATLTVLRAQKGTLATTHAAGTPVVVLGCMDGDETGSNCGGSCKPCSAPAKGGPVQQEKLICVTPAGDSGMGPSGQAAGDLPVTVEAAPGPKESPFRARMSTASTGWLDASASAVSCISEQNRGFQYGAHEFVWGVHFASAAQAEAVQVLDMAVDHNTGETYMVGTMMGAITLQGKHIAMNKKLLGKLSVDKKTAVNLFLTGTAGAVLAPTTIQLATTLLDGDYVGATVITHTGGGAGGGVNCQGTVISSLAANNELTVDAFKNSKDNTTCIASGQPPFYNVYNGKMSFIAKFSKDGRPVWLNKVDAESSLANVMGQAVISSIAVDPAAGTHYVVGHYSDGLQATAAGANTADRIQLNIYSVNTATREAPAENPAKVLKALAVDSYGQVSVDTLKDGAMYQEGFMIKYSSAGQYLASEVIKGKADAQQLIVENLKVRAFHASTSNVINTQAPQDGPAPTEPTKTSRNEVEYDRGVAVSAVQGGGTEERSSIVLSASAATFFQAAGQDLAGVGSVMDDWYNGLTITITSGKGMGQSRRIQDYTASTQTAYVQPHWSGNGEMTPDATSCYSITGKPSSHVHGEHLVNGGIYVTGRLVNVVVSPVATVCFGQMPDAYRDTAASSTGIPVCASFAGVVVQEELNFIAQYDNSLRAYWVRFLYDSDVTTSVAGAGDITAVTTMDDMVFVTGTFGYHAARSVVGVTAKTADVKLRLQNCTFDSATVSQGPPANTQPTVTTLKKLCRTQIIARTKNTAMNQLLPGETVQRLEGGVDTFTGVTAAASDYIVANTVDEDFVDVNVVAFAASPTTSLMFTAAYDGSGKLVWYHYTSAANVHNAISTTPVVDIKPTAMTHVRPAIGNKPLSGYWKMLSDTERGWTSRGQPIDATSAKDVSSERVDSATVKGGFIYIVGTIKNTIAENFADFGITKYPLECSNGKTLGLKGQDLRKFGDAPCAGKLQSTGAASTDVFLVKFSARGGPRADWSMSEYGTASVQPAVQWIRRTGLADKDDTASAVAVHDLTGAIFVTGTYLSSFATKYQGSDIGEKRYLAAVANDGGAAYVAARASTVLNGGDDVFGLKAAGRVNAVGCPMQRAAPYDEHEERMGLTGIPDCTFYSHAAATTTATGFVVKFNDNGDEMQRGNKNSKFQKSITGYVKTADSTFATSIAPCQGTGSDPQGTGAATHVLTGAATCATSPRGCSCLVLATARDSQVFSKTNTSPLGATATTDDLSAAGVGTGMRIRITSGKAAGYEGIISQFKSVGGTPAYTGAGVFYTIPALPEMPDEHSQFTLQPWNNLQPNIHLRTCTASSGMGCAAYGVEWAKTIGWSIAQTKVTPANPTNVEGGVYGTWTDSGTPASTATQLYLDRKDEVTAQATAFYAGYWVELSTQTPAQVLESGSKAIAVARVTAYIIPTADTNGGNMTISCADRPTGCPTGVTRYRLIAKSTVTTGIADLESKASYQQSMPQSVSIMDSDVYVGGWFKGFDRFRFGIEGVDETIGYKSVNVDTWETYLVKLAD